MDWWLYGCNIGASVYEIAQRLGLEGARFVQLQAFKWLEERTVLENLSRSFEIVDLGPGHDVWEIVTATFEKCLDEYRSTVICMLRG